jgi:hypothetical protein
MLLKDSIDSTVLVDSTGPRANVISYPNKRKCRDGYLGPHHQTVEAKRVMERKEQLPKETPTAGSPSHTSEFSI